MSSLIPCNQDQADHLNKLHQTQSSESKTILPQILRLYAITKIIRQLHVNYENKDLKMFFLNNKTEDLRKKAHDFNSVFQDEFIRSEALKSTFIP